MRIKRQENLLRCMISHIAYITGSPVIIAFSTCLFWSLYFDFKSTTQTHCRVANFLPSISAAIGDKSPQRYIWRFGVAIHAAPRILFIHLYRNFYTNIFHTRNVYFMYYLSKIATLFNILEITALLVLSFVSSSENYAVHEKAFISFIIFSQLYMIVTVILISWIRKNVVEIDTRKLTRSFRYKSWLYLTNLIGLLLSLYFFERHMEYCEPYMYSYFALCEYVVVFSNVFFHLTASIDFNTHFLEVTDQALEKIN